jgi:hypothetical protein
LGITQGLRGQSDGGKNDLNSAHDGDWKL